MADLDFFAIVTTEDPRRAGWRAREVPARGPFARSEVARVEARADIARRSSVRSRRARGVTWARGRAKRRSPRREGLDAADENDASHLERDFRRFPHEPKARRVIRATKIADWFPCAAETVGRGSATASCHDERTRLMISCPRKRALFLHPRSGAGRGIGARARGPAQRHRHVVQRRDDYFPLEHRGSVARGDRRVARGRVAQLRVDDAPEHHHLERAAREAATAEPAGGGRQALRGAVRRARRVLGRRLALSRRAGPPRGPRPTSPA